MPTAPKLRHLLDALLAVALAASLYTDLRYRLILNVVTVPTLFISLIARGGIWGWRRADAPELGLRDGLIGAALVFAGGVVLYANGAVAGGDVKLLTDVGAALGVENLMWLMPAFIVCGGIEERVFSWVEPELVFMPYSVAIAAAWACAVAARELWRRRRSARIGAAPHS